MQATAVLGDAPGRADQRPQPGRIDERDPVQVNDQRPAAVRQLEQALPQLGHGRNVDLPGDRRDHDAAFAADRDGQSVTHDQPPVTRRQACPDREPGQP